MTAGVNLAPGSMALFYPRLRVIAPLCDDSGPCVGIEFNQLALLFLSHGGAMTPDCAVFRPVR